MFSLLLPPIERSTKRRPQLRNAIRYRLRLAGAEVVSGVGVPGFVKVLPVRDGQDKPPGRIDHLEAVVELDDLSRLLKTVQFVHHFLPPST
jgi:hypothetical protein